MTYDCDCGSPTLFTRTGRILCALFGHIYPTRLIGKGQGYMYAGKVCDLYPDGIQRVHANVYSTCPRCGERFLLCKIHVPRIKAEVRP